MLSFRSTRGEDNLHSFMGTARGHANPVDVRAGRDGVLFTRSVFDRGIIQFQLIEPSYQSWSRVLLASKILQRVMVNIYFIMPTINETSLSSECVQNCQQFPFLSRVVTLG